MSQRPTLALNFTPRGNVAPTCGGTFQPERRITPRLDGVFDLGVADVDGDRVDDILYATLDGLNVYYGPCPSH
jgi:hypothetical protein